MIEDRVAITHLLCTELEDPHEAQTETSKTGETRILHCRANTSDILRFRTRHSRRSARLNKIELRCPRASLRTVATDGPLCG